MIWNESIECMDRESLRKIQSIRLKKTVERVYHDTPFYRKKMHTLVVDSLHLGRFLREDVEMIL